MTIEECQDNTVGLALVYTVAIYSFVLFVYLTCRRVAIDLKISGNIRQQLKQ